LATSRGVSASEDNGWLGCFRRASALENTQDRTRYPSQRNQNPRLPANFATIHRRIRRRYSGGLCDLTHYPSTIIIIKSCIKNLWIIQNRLCSLKHILNRSGFKASKIFLAIMRQTNNATYSLMQNPALGS
jgi:hypothetical protein